MYLAFFVITFILIFFIFFAYDNKCSSDVCTHFRESFIKAFLVQSLLVWIGTEIFSHFRIVTAPVIYSFWLFTAIILFIIFIIRFRKRFSLSLGVLLKHPAIHNKTYWVGFLLFFVFFIVPLLFIALYYPPSNGDSLGYHLLRVEHWIQNAGVAHYPTPEWRQLYHQPFAEFIILHIRLLAGSDFWVNLVQFFAMIGSLITVSLIAQLFGLPAKFQILSSIILFSLPVGILQSTTTQTDYLASFLFLIFIYHVLKIIILQTSCLVGDAFWGALALGLGCLTKLTIASFALPFCLWLAIISFVRGWRNAFFIGAVFVSIFLILHGPFWFRNYMVEGNILGHQGLVTLMKNDAMSGSLFASNVIRGLSNHAALPIGNSFLVKGITWVHERVLGVSPTDARTTMGNNYSPYFSLYENAAGNFLLFFLIMFLIVYFIFNAKRFVAHCKALFHSCHPVCPTELERNRESCPAWHPELACPSTCSSKPWQRRKLEERSRVSGSILLIYLLCSLSGLLLFYSLFRWQVLLSRLDFPFFVVIIPLLSWFFYDIYTKKNAVSVYLVTSALGGLALYWLIAFYYKNIRLTYVLFFSLLIMLWCIVSVRKKARELLIRVLVSSCVLFSIPYVYFNSVRPLCENFDCLCASRDMRYFVFGPNEGLYQPTKDIEKFFLDNHISNIAIEWGNHYNGATNGSFEYPLRAMFFNAGKKFEIRYIDSPSLYARFSKRKNVLNKSLVSICPDLSAKLDANIPFVLSEVEEYERLQQNNLHNIQAIVSWVGNVTTRYGSNAFVMCKKFSILGETVECAIFKNNGDV